MIEAYCKQFFGYGRWDAPIWFVGLEEAGAGTPEELQSRLLAWDQRGRRELEDAPTFYPACGQNQWHGQGATLQKPTWRQLMRMLLLARGEPIGENALLEYQQQDFGAFAGNVCLTELSPLPTRNQTHWPYADHAGLPGWLQTRDQFMEKILPARIATLREKIAIHHPRAVLFYFWKHRQSAEAVAGGEFQLLLHGDSCGALRDELLGFSHTGTQYFITGHPAAQYPGDPDNYFAELGQHFQNHYRKLFASKPRVHQKTNILMHLSPKFEQALHYATLVHAHQVRKGSGTPYIAHLLGVASITLENGGNENEAIAALLHDAGEDAGGDGRIADIRHRFGDAVADIVQGCTDAVTIPKPPWRKRKEDYIAHIPTASASVRLVSSSDKLYNARAILADFRQVGDDVWKRFTGGKDGTLWYYRSLISAFRQAGSSPLIDELNRVVTETEHLAKSGHSSTTNNLFIKMASPADLSPGHRAWNGNDRTNRNYHNAVPLDEDPFDIALKWKASPSAPLRPVGCFRLNLAALLAEGFIRRDQMAGHVRLRFFHDLDDCIYIETWSGAPRLLIGKVQMP